MKRQSRKAATSRKKAKPSARAPKTLVSPKLTAFAPPEHDPLADSRLRPLVERYASLAGARIVETGPQLAELRVPAPDRGYFGGRDRLLVAFSVSALEQSPEAEMAIIGSPFVEQMLSAIRARGARLTLGLVPPGPDAETEAATLSVPVKNGTAAKPKVRVTRHPVGRLLARVLIRAGATVEEHLVESGFFDLAAGAPLPADVTEQCATIQQTTIAPKKSAKAAAKGAARAGERPASARSAAELVRLMTTDLESSLGPRIERLRTEAEQALTEELARIDKYYRTMLEDVSAKETDGLAAAEAGRAIEAEHARRRLEEERRHQVRAVVHPLQMVEMEMVVQRAEWVLSAAKGEQGKLAARRYLGGPGGWSLSCPSCAQVPSALILCGAGEIGCASCAHQCAVCGDGFRVSETASECHVDGAHVCAKHLHSCSSCERTHCTTHETQCAEGGHAACTSCVASCAGCGGMVCTSHAVTTAETAPGGRRRLCGQCVVYCEGRRNEPVGRDEVATCASCERFVCERHQTRCVVDDRVHCSTHLARTNHSRALVCDAHRGSCHHEPEAILAASEVNPCPVCGRSTCATHLHECASCGRLVCVAEWEATSSLCGTCRQLAPCGIPSEVERAAAKEAADGEVPKQKHWRVARDLTHQVFELAHGGQRRTVFALPHGESVAETVVLHGLHQRARKR